MIFLGGLNYCNVMIRAVLPWKERIFWSQLQFFSLRAVWELITVMQPRLFYRIYLFRK